MLHRAAGVIMARWGCPEDEAQRILVMAAAALSTPVTVLAERLVAATDRNGRASSIPLTPSM